MNDFSALQNYFSNLTKVKTPRVQLREHYMQYPWFRRRQISDYWPDYEDLETTDEHVERYQFSSRTPKPEWFNV